MSTLKTTNIQHPSAASPAVELTAAGGLWLGGGKVLQVVRATDTVQRITTSTSFVDGGISVTITPQKSTSAVILIWSADTSHSSTTNYAIFQITDASNNAVSGAEGAYVGSNSTTLIEVVTTIIGYATPATTSATTYKVRFCASSSGTAQINNNGPTGQLYAIEVSA